MANKPDEPQWRIAGSPAEEEARARAAGDARDAAGDRRVHDTAEAAYDVLSERKKPDGWREAEQVAKRRAKTATIGQLITNIARQQSAIALLKMRRRAAAFTKRLPTPQQWDDFYRAEILPLLREVSSRWTRCASCGERFLWKAGQEHCSNTCSSRERGRRWRKAGGTRRSKGDALSRKTVPLDEDLVTRNAATELTMLERLADRATELGTTREALAADVLAAWLDDKQR